MHIIIRILLVNIRLYLFKILDRLLIYIFSPYIHLKLLNTISMKYILEEENLNSEIAIFGIILS